MDIFFYIIYTMYLYTIIYVHNYRFDVGPNVVSLYSNTTKFKFLHLYVVNIKKKKIVFA